MSKRLLCAALALGLIGLASPITSCSESSSKANNAGSGGTSSGGTSSGGTSSGGTNSSGANSGGTDSGATDSGTDSGFPSAAAVRVQSDSTRLWIEVRTAPEQPPVHGSNTVELTITDASGTPVDGLTVVVVPWMPSMGHGSTTTPAVSPQGQGKYLVTNVTLQMAGTWELRLTITLPDGGEETAAPALDVQ